METEGLNSSAKVKNEKNNDNNDNNVTMVTVLSAVPVKCSMSNDGSDKALSRLVIVLGKRLGPL